MAKETTKKAKTSAKASKPEKEVKKNPLLDADEDTSDEKEVEDTEETTDEAEADEEAEDGDDSEADEEVEEAPKKVTKAPKEAEKPKVNVADQATSDVRTTKEILDNEEQVHFMIPLFEGEKPGAIHECFINGYRYPVKKGIMTMVPRSIADLLANHYKINLEAGADYRLDLHPSKDVSQSQ